MTKKREQSSILVGYFDIIEQCGEDRLKARNRLRNKILKKGKPDAKVYDLEEEDYTFRMWHVEGGVVCISFREERPDIDSIRTYTDEFIKALIKARKAKLR